MGSILAEVKETLGLSTDADGFDPELITHINSVLSDMNQLGVGPKGGFEITNDSATWEEFLGTDPRYNDAKSFAFLRVKMLFDPPQTGYVLTAYEKMIEKAEWRLSVTVDEPALMLVGGTTALDGNAGDEHVLRLHNPTGLVLIETGGEYEAEFVSSSGVSTPVILDTSEVDDEILLLPVVVQNGKYIIRRLNPRRTILTVEVTAK